MKKLLIAACTALLAAWLLVGGTVNGQTTATPTPTSTSSGPPPPPPPPGGATPTPTATVTPTPSPTPVPLTAVEKLAHSSVSPRSKQSVTVTTLANASVALAIKFPNGNVKRASGTAGANGQYKFTYVQPGSRITHSSRKTSVTATATMGTETASATKTYTIGFAPLDVSAEPRSVSRGKAVTIWVHTAANTRFAVVLRYSSAFASGGGIGRTGGNGWASERVSIPSNAPKGSVDVRGSARVNGRLAGGETSFRVK